MSRKRPGGILGIRRQRQEPCDNTAAFALEYPGPLRLD